MKRRYYYIGALIISIFINFGLETDSSTMDKIFFTVIWLFIFAILRIILVVVLYPFKSIFKKIKSNLPDVGVNTLDKFSGEVSRENVNYISNTSEYFSEMNRIHTKKDINTIGIKKNSEQGAYVVINKNLLKKNKKMISSGKVNRDSESRQYANVRGFNTIKNNPVMVNKKKVFPYHRTHLLPFRFCLSDGDIQDIMFTGTSHLNMGDRPYNNYIVSDDYSDFVKINLTNLEYPKDANGSLQSRKNVLLDYFSINKVFGETYSVAIAKNRKKDFVCQHMYNLSAFSPYILSEYQKNINERTQHGGMGYYLSDEDKKHYEDLVSFYKDTHISLNDVERYVDSFIMQSPDNSIFTYAVTCNYDNSSEIPTSVTIFFRNDTLNDTILKLTLDNVH